MSRHIRAVGSSERLGCFAIAAFSPCLHLASSIGVLSSSALLLESTSSFKDSLHQLFASLHTLRFVTLFSDQTARTGDGSRVASAVSLNLHRRHLNESQRAMVAARLSNLDRGRRKNTEISGISQSDDADLLNVSRETVSAAKRVQREGAPELVADRCQNPGCWIAAGNSLSAAIARCREGSPRCPGTKRPVPRPRPCLGSSRRLQRYRPPS